MRIAATSGQKQHTAIAVTGRKEERAETTSTGSNGNKGCMGTNPTQNRGEQHENCERMVGKEQMQATAKGARTEANKGQ